MTERAGEPTDEALVRAANRGDPAAFEQLYERHREWVLGVALRFTGDRELALDVMQQTFLYLLRQFPGFELRARLHTFLYPVIRHTVLAAMRKRRRRSDRLRLYPPRPDPAEPVPERLSPLHEAITRLPVGQREVVILRFADGLDLTSIAQALGVPVGTVKSRLHLALKTLRANESLRSYFQE